MNTRNCKYVFLLTAILCQACAPKPLWMGDTPPGTPMFQKGWEHGCTSGLATVSNSYYKSFYRFQQDPPLVKNPEYFNAWMESFVYCKDYVDKWTFKEWDEGDIWEPNY